MTQRVMDDTPALDAIANVLRRPASARSPSRHAGLEHKLEIITALVNNTGREV
jgi:hypothetical protein